jgi:nucleoside-diphosphate-sugar epimerase
MRYLVTGATGFIGTNIVERLAQTGATIVAFSNVEPSVRQKKMWNEVPGEVIFSLGDVRDQSALEKLIDEHKVEKLIHAAVITSDAERERTQGPLVVDVNLRGAAVASNAAARKGLARFVLVGSGGVFSLHNLQDGMVVPETHPHQVDSLYGIGKSAAEMIVSRICSLNGLPFVIGRVATAFGPWEHDTGYRDTLSPLYQLTRLAREGKPAFLSRDKKSNWHYARDAAAAVAVLAESDVTRFIDYNLGPQWVWPLSAWCERLAQHFPNFTYEFGSEESNIMLYGDKDGALLSGDRFINEFGLSCHDIEMAFLDFMTWLEC